MKEALNRLSVAAQTPGLTKIVELDEVTDGLNISVMRPVCPPLSLGYGHPLGSVRATSACVSDACPINQCSTNGLKAEVNEYPTDDFCHNYRVHFKELGLDSEALGMGKIKELQNYLDIVKRIARPGCSEEVLNVALSSMSSLVKMLSGMSSHPKPHASL